VPKTHIGKMITYLKSGSAKTGVAEIRPFSLTLYKNQLKTLKLLEGNIGELFQVLDRHGQDFLITTPVAQEIRTRIDQRD
jgi:hypothetical protein